jgi:hypothetical protein
MRLLLESQHGLERDWEPYRAPLALLVKQGYIHIYLLTIPEQLSLELRKRRPLHGPPGRIQAAWAITNQPWWEKKGWRAAPVGHEQARRWAVKENCQQSIPELTSPESGIADHCHVSIKAALNR